MTSSAWQLAVQQHLATLSDSQKAAFRAPANADICLNMIVRAQGRKRGFTRLMQLMRPLIDPLKRFEGAIDVLMNVHGAVAAPIWAPLRVAITVASDYINTLESLAMILHRVVSSLERFENYENLFKTNPAVQKAIGTLYSDLIDFCTRVVRFYSRSSVRAMLTSFDKEFRHVSDQINFHSAEVDWVANATNIAESQRAREMERKLQAENLQMNVQRWLSPSSMQDDLHRHQLEYMHGSCDPFLKAPQVQSLINSMGSMSLRIQARPGGGKSVLASFLINHLKGRKENVLYFFCEAGDPEKRSTIHVLRTLLSQALRIDQSLYAEVELFYTRSGRAAADSYVDVHAAFTLIVSKLTRKGIYIIIDALDECQDSQGLVRILFDAQGLASGKMCMVFTCRPLELPVVFTVDLNMERKHTSMPIKKYVEARTLQMKTLSDVELRMMVVDEVSGAADGLWLYVRLMLDELQRMPSTAFIQRHLQNVPRGLTQLYSQILRLKESEFTEAHLKLAQQVFLWVDVSDYMPPFLALDYLPHETMCLLFRYVNFGEPVIDPVRLASELCFPLIEIHDTYRDIREMYELDPLEGYQVRFTHHTADQYIRESSKLPAANLPAVLKPRRLQQLYRAITAVWYFTSCEVSESHLRTLIENKGSGLDYGSYFEMTYGLRSGLTLVCLPHDLDGAEQAEATNLLRNLSDFVSVESGQCLRWLETAAIINYAAGWTQLLEKAEESLAIIQQAQTSSNALPAFNSFQECRTNFFRDYVYVLQMTAPCNYGITDEPVIPDGFQTRPLASKMMEVGRRWQHLHRRSISEMRLLDAPLHEFEDSKRASESLKRNVDFSISENIDGDTRLGTTIVFPELAESSRSSGSEWKLPYRPYIPQVPPIDRPSTDNGTAERQNTQNSHLKPSSLFKCESCGLEAAKDIYRKGTHFRSSNRPGPLQCPADHCKSNVFGWYSHDHLHEHWHTFHLKQSKRYNCPQPDCTWYHERVNGLKAHMRGDHGWIEEQPEDVKEA